MTHRWLTDEDRAKIRNLRRDGATTGVIQRLWPGTTVRQIERISNDVLATPSPEAVLSSREVEYGFTWHWVPRPERCVSVPPTAMPGSIIRPPSLAQLMAGR